MAPAAPLSAPLDPADYAAYTRRVQDKARGAENKLILRKLLERYKVVIEQLGHGGIRKVFLKLDDARTGFVQLTDFKKSLAALNFTTSEQDLFSEYFFHGESSSVGR